MGYSSRRPHRVPLCQLRTGNGGYNSHRLTQNWAIEDWKNVCWSDESRFLLRHKMIGSEFGIKTLKAWIHPALSQLVQAGGGGVMVWGIFSWDTLGPLVQLSIVYTPQPT